MLLALFTNNRTNRRGGERGYSIQKGGAAVLLREAFHQVLGHLEKVCCSVYGVDLVSVVVFGSVSRGTPSPTSDIDLLIVTANLPNGRIPRVQQFASAEALLQPHIEALREHDIDTCISPVIKTPEEVQVGSLLFLDMTRDALIIYDKDGFFGSQLAKLRSKLQSYGAYRVEEGQRWHWVIKPDYSSGDVFDI